MNLSVYIKEYLRDHESIVVPRFGTFTAIYRTAYTNEHTRVFYPPAKIVTFDPNRDQDDGVLIEYLMQKRGISREDAKNDIKDFINKLHEKFEAGKTVHIADFGSFLEKGDAIYFDYASKDNLLTEAYGLPQVSLQFQEKTEAASNQRFADNQKEVVVEPKPAIAPINTPQTEIIPEIQRKSHTGLWILVGAVLPIVAAAVYVFYFTTWMVDIDIKQTISSWLPAKTEQPAPIEQPVVADSVELKLDTTKAKINQTIDSLNQRESALTYQEIKAQKKADSIARQPVAKTAEPKTTTIPVKQPVVDKKPASSATPDKSTFYLIVGSFQNLHKAQVLQKQLIAEGFEAEVLRANETTFRVSCARFTNKNKAVAEMEKLRAKGKQIWLWTY